jgi:hypothetical protein
MLGTEVGALFRFNSVLKSSPCGRGNGLTYQFPYSFEKSYRFVGSKGSAEVFGGKDWIPTIVWMHSVKVDALFRVENFESRASHD